MMKRNILSATIVIAAVGWAVTHTGSTANGDTAQPSAHDHSSHSPAAPPPVSPNHVSAPNATYYTCPMHPSVNSPTPGTCPICGMNLVAVTRGAEQDATVEIDPVRSQRIGVKTVAITQRPLTANVRALGRVVYDESRLVDVTLKYDGWIGELFADFTGKRVEKGQPLFTLYSPELFAAQQELLAAIASRNAAGGSSAPRRADYLVAAAEQRLRLWDLTEEQIREIARSSAPQKYLRILSPASGYLVEKNAVAGTSVEPGLRLFRIADLSKVWIEADLYEDDIGRVNVGDIAKIRVANSSSAAIKGAVTFVYPWLDGATRTARVRIEVENPDLLLKPDMYADVTLALDLGTRLAVPENAILYAGDKRYVFIELGEGRFGPRAVTTGGRAGDWIVVESGLHEGERIVVSGTFLVAAESRLKIALEDWK